MNTIHESLETPVLGEYDVIVCGGGISGLTAAVSAARLGASVLLLEKGVLLGGLATAGLISWYEPLCDGRGRRIMNGMAYELLRLCIQYGFHDLPEGWMPPAKTSGSGKRLCTNFSHSLFAMALDEWLLDSGVKLLLDTCVTRPYVTGSRIDGVFVENKDGRGCYRCRVIIDCTGDADIALRSGIPWENGVNYLTYIGYYSDTQTAKAAAEKQNMLLARKWHNSGADLWGRGHPEGLPCYTGVDAEQLTDFVIRGRRRLFEQAKSAEPFSRDYSALPSMAQYRKTRRIIGEYTLTEADQGKHFDHSVAAVGDFARRGQLYEIPYETLYHRKIENLYVAGRCISSTGWAWDVTRVIPAAAATGEAAGAAAVLCCRENTANHALSVGKLQDQLLHQGVWLHF